MTPPPDAAVKHDKYMRGLAVIAMAAGRKAWRRVRPDNISTSWTDAVAALVPVVTQIQLSAAKSALAYPVDALAEQGEYVPPEGFGSVAAFAGLAADGRSLEGLLYSPATTAKERIAAGWTVAEALKAGGTQLDLMMKTTVADTGRAAAGVDIASRESVGWTRMLNPPSCSRCALLAGKFYRWNEGFLRHPRCDCRHVPSMENIAGDLTTDPYEYFNSLTRSEQDKAFTKAGAQAVRDGGDIFQVVNSRRGMKPGGLMTTEGTTRRGNFRRSAADSTRGRRLTPEAIYKLNGENRTAALADLERYGYILPGGQDPLGVIVGQREGLGALGRGGTRVGARNAVMGARQTGSRNPDSRYTMTEAERRLFDARSRWDDVRNGRNPFGKKGEGLTPQIAATVEKDYRRWLASGGEIFTN